jgi:uncharacterized protein
VSCNLQDNVKCFTWKQRYEVALGVQQESGLFTAAQDVPSGIRKCSSPHSQSALNGKAPPIRRHEDRQLLCYTSRPIRKDMEVTGSPTIDLILSSTASDGEFFAYLEDVDPRGRVSYVTEGELRALDRAVSSDPPYPRPGPYHSFQRKDGLPLTPGDIVSIDFAMIPTSYLFKRGHAIRLALAGADRDHFAVLPGPGPVWIVYRDAAQQSCLDLPVRETGPR